MGGIGEQRTSRTETALYPCPLAAAWRLTR